MSWHSNINPSSSYSNFRWTTQLSYICFANSLFDIPSSTKKGFCKKNQAVCRCLFHCIVFSPGHPVTHLSSRCLCPSPKRCWSEKNAACDVTKATSSEMVQTFAVQTLPCRGQQLALSHPQECCHFHWPSFFCWHCWHIIRVIAACPDWNVCGTGICFWLRRSLYPLRCERSYARNTAEVVR